MNYCGKCGNRIIGNAKLCAVCGRSIYKWDTDGECVCNNCGINLAPTSKFCPKCGAKAPAFNITRLKSVGCAMISEGIEGLMMPDLSGETGDSTGILSRTKNRGGGGYENLIKRMTGV